MKQCLFVLAILFIVVGCGVKGDPRPPEKPADIGRGKPTYKRAFQNIKIKNLKTKKDDEDDNEKNNEDNEE